MRTSSVTKVCSAWGPAFIIADDAVAWPPRQSAELDRRGALELNTVRELAWQFSIAAGGFTDESNVDLTDCSLAVINILLRS